MNKYLNISLEEIEITSITTLSIYIRSITKNRRGLLWRIQENSLRVFYAHLLELISLLIVLTAS